ncbi:hypothetical protein J6590_017764 [Homalodisca vitripennis]|nr:hypothetical protein J6590_017764 [Homalodisca vitripennis]
MRCLFPPDDMWRSFRSFQEYISFLADTEQPTYCIRYHLNFVKVRRTETDTYRQKANNLVTTCGSQIPSLCRYKGRILHVFPRCSLDASLETTVESYWSTRVLQ